MSKKDLTPDDPGYYLVNGLPDPGGFAEMMEQYYKKCAEKRAQEADSKSA